MQRNPELGGRDQVFPDSIAFHPAAIASVI